MIGKIIHNFRIVSQIGEGGMGVVYLAEHLEFSKRFAIKSLSKALSNDPQFRGRFHGEAQKQAMLDHPNIVQVTDFFEAEGQCFLVMEYVDGQDLSKLIQSRGRLPEREALRIFQDILSALAFAHGKGLIHRDIKPSNVLVDGQGRARIMDFGIAILAGAGEKRHTATGATIGSACYMSPEQIQRPKQLDLRTDIYSLGIVLYEMLAGNVPFDGETEFAVHEQQIHSPAPDLHQKQPDIPQELAQIVRRALAKVPAERFHDCTEFLGHIQAYEATAKRPDRRWDMRQSLLWGLAATLLVSVGIATLMTFKQVPDKPNGPIDDGPVQSKLAYNLIQTASEKALTICRELERVELKKVGLNLAGGVDSSTADALRKQIEDLDKNIGDAVPAYSGLVNQLVSLRSAIVDAEFENYTQALTKISSFQQIPMTRMMRHHYEKYRRGNNNAVDVGSMRADCGQAAKGT